MMKKLMRMDIELIGEYCFLCKSIRIQTLSKKEIQNMFIGNFSERALYGKSRKCFLNRKTEGNVFYNHWETMVFYENVKNVKFYMKSSWEPKPEDTNSSR